MTKSSAMSGLEFAYLPITFRELVSQISKNTVTGSCSESSAWLHTSPANAS